MCVMDKVVFSGIQPSGSLHIGNYLGAIKQWVAGQNDLSASLGQDIFCVVDMHAITVPQDPEVLNKKTADLVGWFLAAGLDPDKSLLFVQSHNPDHANLAWVLNCFASMGQVSRMTQYKEKAEGKEFVSVGLFDYPVLMAADILLYGTTEVPVGEDQKQHVELARDLAERFNAKFGETFVLPTPTIPKIGGRIMSLVDPTAKMSKSDANPNATIGLMDSEEEIKKKIAGATTDSERTIKYDPNRKGLANLMNIYSLMSGESIENIEKKFEGKGYKEFKENLVEMVIGELKPMQKRYSELRNGDGIMKVLKNGAQKAREISHKKLLEVYKKVGFLPA